MVVLYIWPKLMIVSDGSELLILELTIRFKTNFLNIENYNEAKNLNELFVVLLMNHLLVF